MTSYEISKHLQTLLDATGADRALTKYLFVLAKGHEKVTDELVSVLQSRSRSFFSMQQQTTQERFAELRRQADTFPLGQIFHDTIELRNLLGTLASAFEANESHFFREMSRHVAHFYEVFEKLVRDPSKETFASLLPEAHHLYTVVVTSRQFFAAMKQALQQQTPVLPSKGRLTLMFETTSSLPSIVRALGALDTGYREICRVTGVSVEQHPLTVVRLEAASLWVCVEGEKVAIGILTSLIESFALFWYHRFTSEDRGADCSERVSATQTLVSLADQLERAGIMNVSPDAAEIRDAALVLRAALMDLLEHEPALLVNDKPYSVDASLRKHYLALSEQFSQEPTALRERSLQRTTLQAAGAPVTAAGAN